jgi:hypothetical protein
MAAVIDVVVIIVVDAAVHTRAVARRENRNHPRGGTDCCLADNDPSGFSALLVDEATRGSKANCQQRNTKNGFHSLGRFQLGIAAGHRRGRIACINPTELAVGAFVLDVTLAIAE